MKTLDKGQDKIKKISELLRHEVLEPAKDEAKKIIEGAQAHALEIIADAKKEAHRIIEEGRKIAEQEKNVVHSALSQAGKQSIEALRQDIEHHLFSDQLHTVLNEGTANPKVIAALIDAVIKAIEKEGIGADLMAYIPKSVSVKEVNQLLLEETLKKLKSQTVELGGFTGGARVRLLDKNLTIDVSEEALKELLAKYVRKDFRKLLFGI